jgi:catechol 2,3-dioxygenase-like lactoylglutathione lyase family enzyme
MLLLDHVSITVQDLDRARPFYDAVMAALGAEKVFDRFDALGYGERCDGEHTEHTYLTVTASPEVAPDLLRHWCFKAGSHAQVNAFYKQGLQAGGHDDGRPGYRHGYHRDYYSAYLLDPDGNRIEAVSHRPE